METHFFYGRNEGEEKEEEEGNIFCSLGNPPKVQNLRQGFSPESVF